MCELNRLIYNPEIILDYFHQWKMVAVCEGWNEGGKMCRDEENQQNNMESISSNLVTLNGNSIVTLISVELKYTTNFSG